MFSASDRPFTLGNVRYLKHNVATPSLLAQESTHVWQYQHTGPTSSKISTTSWGRLSAERQAELIEDATSKQLFGPAYRRAAQIGVTAAGPTALAEFNYMVQALKHLQAGEGAVRP